MKIEFTTNNDAFNNPCTNEPDNTYKAKECQRILESIITKMENGYMYGPIMDINGNKIGTWEM